MKRYPLIFAPLFCQFILIACSYVTHATLFNNTGGKIEVAWESKKISILAGAHTEIDYVITSILEARITDGGCEYFYRVPIEPRRYKPDRKLDRGIQLQVEKDFSVNVLPADYAGDASTAGVMFPQPEGYPLRPVSRQCR